MNSHAATAYDIPFTLVSDIFTPTHWCFIGVLHASHQVLKDFAGPSICTANKQGEPVTARVVTTSHPLSPQKNTKKKSTLDIQRHLLRRWPWIPNFCTIQTPNL